MEAEEPGEVARRGPDEQRPVGQPQHGESVFRRARSGPTRRQVGRVGRQPFVGDLVAREEPAQLAARRVPAVPDHRHARRGRLGGDALEPPDALARERTDLHGDLRQRRRGGVVLPGLHAHDPRGFRRPVAAHERRTEGDRHLAENLPRHAPAQRPFDAVDQLDDLDLAGEDRVERAVPALGNGEFSGAQVQVGGRPREALEFDLREPREQRNLSDVVSSQHGSVSSELLCAASHDVVSIALYLLRRIPQMGYLCNFVGELRRTPYRRSSKDTLPRGYWMQRCMRCASPK